MGYGENEKKGCTPFMVSDGEPGWHKIRVSPYPSKDEADQAALDLKNAQA